MSVPISFDANYLAQLESLRIESRKKFLGSRQGGHLSLKKGHGLEFSDYRQYELGDNPRYIDWKAYGKTDKLFVKQFQEEQDLLISVFLDGSESMGQETDPQKWEFSSKLALSFCYMGLMQQDKVALSVLGQGAPVTLAGPQSFPQFARKISQRGHLETSAFGSSLKNAALRIKFPGVAIVISDFHSSLEEIDIGFRQLRSRNLDIVALQVLGPRDLEPILPDDFSQLLDAETGETFDLEFDEERAKQLQELIYTHTSKCREYFRQRQIGFTTLTCTDDIVASLRKSQHALRVIK